MPYTPTHDALGPTSRISDADRDTAVESLTQHVSTGRLGIEEFDARARQTYAAVTRSDLDAVFADLPVAPALSGRTRTVERARSHPREFLTWASISVLCLTIWAITSIATGNFLYPWPVWVIGPWGAVLAVQRVTGTSFACADGRTFGR